MPLTWTCRHGEQGLPWPSARYGHSMTETTDGIFLYGGWTGDAVSSELWNLLHSGGEEYVWRLIPTSRTDRYSPGPRFKHNATVFGSHLWIWGGDSTGTEKECTAYCYNLVQRAFVKKVKFSQCASRTDALVDIFPTSDAHAEQVVMWSGYSPEDPTTSLNDSLIKLDFVNHTATEIAKVPKELCRLNRDVCAMATIRGTSNIVLIGGAHVAVFDAAKSTFTAVFHTSPSSSPLPRVQASVTAFGRNSLYLMGGKDAEAVMWSLAIDTGVWTRVAPDHLWYPVPAVLYDHRTCAVANPQRLLFFGGRTGVTGAASNNLLVFRTSASWDRFRMRIRAISHMIILMQRIRKRRQQLHPSKLSSLAQRDVASDNSDNEDFDISAQLHSKANGFAAQRGDSTSSIHSHKAFGESLHGFLSELAEAQASGDDRQPKLMRQLQKQRTMARLENVHQEVQQVLQSVSSGASQPSSSRSVASQLAPAPAPNPLHRGQSMPAMKHQQALHSMNSDLMKSLDDHIREIEMYQEQTGRDDAAIFSRSNSRPGSRPTSRPVSRPVSRSTSPTHSKR